MSTGILLTTVVFCKQADGTVLYIFQKAHDCDLLTSCFYHYVLYHIMHNDKLHDYVF